MFSPSSAISWEYHTISPPLKKHRTKQTLPPHPSNADNNSADNNNADNDATDKDTDDNTDNGTAKLTTY
jgi:hypothetical protein